MDKLANNILEYMLDPTKVPVKQRLYFRDEEVLDNSAFDRAKQDSDAAYGAQRQNADFYPQRKRTMQQPQREASAMDRRSLIASFDILSKQFNPAHPIATDLRTMAVAVSKMSDEDLAKVVAVEAPNFGCVVASEDASGDAESRFANAWIDLMGKVRKELTRGNTKPSFAEVAKETKKRWDAQKKKKTADQNAAPGAQPALVPHDEATETPEQEAAESVETQKAKREKGQHTAAEWGKEADDLVTKALLASVAPVASKKPVAKKTEKPADAPATPAPAAVTPPAVVTPPAPAPVQAGAVKGPGQPDGTGQQSGTPGCAQNPGTQAPAVKEVAEKTAEVDTSILATNVEGSTFAGIELSSNGTIDDEGMSAEEAARLASILSFDVTQGLEKNDQDKLNALLNNK